MDCPWFDTALRRKMGSFEPLNVSVQITKVGADISSWWFFLQKINALFCW
jgi:hypothetical protein